MLWCLSLVMNVSVCFIVGSKMLSRGLFGLGLIVNLILYLWFCMYLASRSMFLW